jgi:cell division protein FtsW (lipid II flippase)
VVEPAEVSARNRELVTLVLAAVIGSSAFASAWIAGAGSIDYGWLPWAALLAAVFVVAHAFARAIVPDADPTLLPVTGLLCAIGLTFVYRIDPEDGRRQLVWVAVGVGVFVFVLLWLRWDYRALERYKYMFGVSAIVLLMLPSVPGVGQRINGVKLWVDIGPLQFQPGEIAKIFLVVFLAGYLRDKREALARGRLKDFGPLLAIWGGAMLVLVQTSDLGSALLNFGIFLAMLYAATGRLSFVLAGLALFAGGAAVLYDALSRVQQRVTVWLEPWTDDKVYCAINGRLEFRQNCDSYQLVKSLYSIANGGYGGTGIGKGTFETVDGTPLIPYLQTDFVYSAIAQELGLIGAAAVLLCFLALVARGMRVALIAHDGFSKLLAAGLSFGFALQTFIIVGGVLRLVPLTGITLPFISYGGSSIVSNFVMLALLMLVSHRAVRGAAT